MNFKDQIYVKGLIVKCADGIEEKDVLGFVENNKRVYKTKEGVELTGSKKVVEVNGLQATVLINPSEFGLVLNFCEEKG